jgi:hypothetical protein
MESVPLMLDRTYALAGGRRVRVRLARSSDAPAIAELAARRGVELEPLDLARLTRFDPRHRLVIAATALIGSRETVVGVAAVDLTTPAPVEPDVLIFDERIEGLGELLRAALAGRTRAIRPRLAAGSA